MFQFLRRKHRDRMTKRHMANRPAPRRCRLSMEPLERRLLLAGDSPDTGNAVEFVDQSVANMVPTTLEEFKDFGASYLIRNADGSHQVMSNRVTTSQVSTTSIDNDAFLSLGSLSVSGVTWIGDAFVTGTEQSLDFEVITPGRVDEPVGILHGQKVNDEAANSQPDRDASQLQFATDIDSNVTIGNADPNDAVQISAAVVGNEGRAPTSGLRIGNVLDAANDNLFTGSFKIVNDTASDPAIGAQVHTAADGIVPSETDVQPGVDSLNHPPRLNLSDVLGFESAERASSGAGAATASKGLIDVATIVTSSSDHRVADMSFVALFEQVESGSADSDTPAPAPVTSGLGDFTGEANAPVHALAATVSTVELSGTRGRSQAFELAMSNAVDPTRASRGTHDGPTTFDMARSGDPGGSDEPPSFGLFGDRINSLAAAAALPAAANDAANQHAGSANVNVASLSPAELRLAAADAVFARIGNGDDRRLGYVYTEQASPLFVAIVAAAAGPLLIRAVRGFPDGRDRLSPKFISLRPF